MLNLFQAIFFLFGCGGWKWGRGLVLVCVGRLDLIVGAELPGAGRK